MSAEEAVRLAQELLPDIILLDIDMPGGGTPAAPKITSVCPVTRILMLTVSGAEVHVVEALKAGARA